MTLLSCLQDSSWTCFLCDWIVQDLEKHGRLTDWSPADGPTALAPAFPVGGKLLHLKIERFSIDKLMEYRIVDVE